MLIAQELSRGEDFQPQNSKASPSAVWILRTGFKDMGIHPARSRGSALGYYVWTWAVNECIVNLRAGPACGAGLTVATRMHYNWHLQALRCNNTPTPNHLGPAPVARPHLDLHYHTLATSHILKSQS